jgi:hypothetical protein
MEWVAITLTLPRNVVYPALLPQMRKPRLPVVDRTEAPADLNGLVRFGERRNLVSTRVPSRFKRTLPGVSPGGKGGMCVRLTTLPPSCAVFMKYGNLSVLETSGPLQASNGTALIFASVTNEMS